MSTAFNPAKVAVIGLGNIGNIIAQNLVKGNRPVIIADRSPEKAKEIASQLGHLARPLSIAGAITEADLIVFAIWFDAIRELLGQYSSSLEGKIIIDPSNPIAPDEKGGFKKIIPADQSAGEILSTLLPANASLVKAFGSLGAATLQEKAFRTPERAVLFYAADNEKIAGEIEQLIHDAGFDAFKIGGLDQSIRMEVFGDLHEFGALGKAVSIPEAEELMGKLA